MFLINNEEWDLQFVPPFSPILMTEDYNYTLGVTIPAERTIYIADNIYGDLLHHVLTHEIFHAELASRGVFVPLYIEEAICDLVADHELDTINIARNVHNNLCKFYGRC